METTWMILVLLCQLSVTWADGKRALLAVDVQYCFTPGGTLAITGGDDIIPVINDIRKRLVTSFDLVVMSQDWHCVNHVSFASQHSGYGIYDVIDLYYENGDLCQTENVTNSYAVTCSSRRDMLRQVLWPDHCVKNTSDASLHSKLHVEDSDVIIKKGHKCDLDSYSVFYDNGRFAETELRQILEDHDITTLYITGLATDYCVYWTSLDAVNLGFQTYVVIDATRGVAPETTDAAILDMRAHNVTIIQSEDLIRELTSDAASLSPGASFLYRLRFSVLVAAFIVILH